MKIITQRGQLRTSVETLKRHYPDDAEFAKLDSETVTAQQLRELLYSNRDWMPTCNECGTPAPLIVQVGEPPDIESATAGLCPGCLEKARSLMIGAINAMTLRAGR